MGSLLIGGLLYYAMSAGQSRAICPMCWLCRWSQHPINPAEGLLPTEWLAAFRFEWVEAFRDSLHYLPIVIPFGFWRPSWRN